MLPHARLLGGATAVLLVVPALVACEATYPPPAVDDPYTAGATTSDPTSTAALERQLHEAQANLETARAAGSASTPSPAPRSTPPAPERERVVDTQRKPLPAFVAGGEQRIECPAGFHAEAAKDTGCACVSSDDATVAAMTEAPCSAKARAEGGECIFTCDAAPSGS